MIQINLHGNKAVKGVLVPECWDELSPAQLLTIANILFTEQHETLRAVGIARAICGLSKMKFKEIPPVAIVEFLLPETEWVTASCDITKQLLPVLHVDKVDFYGPDDHLRNLRFVEFDFAERALHEWHQHPEDLSLLWAFVATIYRPARKNYNLEEDTDGDKREPFNGNMTAKYGALLGRTLTLEYAFAIMLWYKGCRAFIAERFSPLFSQDEINQSDEEHEPAYFGLMRAIAKEGIYGTFDQVEQLYIYTAFHEMVCALEEQQRIAEEMEAAQNK